MKFRNTIVIRKSQEEVFAYLAQLENLPKWNYAIQQTVKTSPGPTGAGSTYTQTRTLPRPMQEQLQITEFQPGTLLVVQGGFGQFTGSSAYVLRQMSEGITELTNEVNLATPPALKLVAPVVRVQIKQAVMANLNVLKGILE